MWERRSEMCVNTQAHAKKKKGICKAVIYLYNTLNTFSLPAISAMNIINYFMRKN